MDYPRFVVAMSVGGLLLTVFPMLACWVIAERVSFLLRALRERDPVHEALIEVVGSKFPSGNLMIQHAIPLCWTFIWIVLITGEFAASWAKR